MATTQQLLEHPKERLDHPPQAIDLSNEFSRKIKAVGRDSKEAIAVRSGASAARLAAAAMGSGLYGHDPHGMIGRGLCF